MHFTLYISLFSAIINLLIGAYVIFINPKKATNRVFAILVIFIAFFSIGEFITRIATTKELALIGGRIGYSVFSLACLMGIHFSSVFPQKYPKSNNTFLGSKTALAFVYIVGVIIVIILNTLISIKDVILSEFGYRVVLSDSTSFLIFWFLFCTFYSAGNFMHTYLKKNVTISEKKQIEFVTMSFLLVVAFSLGTNLIPPLFNISIFPMASVSFTLFSLMIVFSLKKFKLMSLTIPETADLIVDTMADSLLVIDKDRNIVIANKSTSDMLGYSKEELINTPLEQVLHLDDFESRIFPKVINEGKVENVETKFFTKEGKPIPIYASASTIYDNNNDFQGAVMVGRDVTETKKLINDLEETKNKLEDKVKERTVDLTNANKDLETEIKERRKVEKQIKKSLDEKEVLLKEIHHRVKNNLQIISSLLNLRTGHAKNKKIPEFLKESQNRIKSMSLIHEQLYQSKDLAKIDFEEYMRDLTLNLFYSYGTNPEQISVNTNAKNIYLNIDKAISYGLIINELVSNSLKHAFPRGRKGEITIDFSTDKNNKYTLVVSDNGIGFPKNLDIQNTDTLGLKLVNILTQQLQGSIKLDRSQGTKFKITFQKK